MNEAYLMHYGVKGMKWGVRKSKSSKYSKDYNESRALKRKNYKQLSNEELKTLNKRLELESNYKRLNPNVIQRGLNVSKRILVTSGTIGGLYAIRNTPYVVDGKKAIKKLLS